MEMNVDKQHLLVSLCNLSILWLCTEDPVRCEPLFEPRVAFMYLATSTFSAPLSERTREGKPYLEVTSMKLFRTVEALLLVAHLR